MSRKVKQVSIGAYLLHFSGTTARLIFIYAQGAAEIKAKGKQYSAATSSSIVPVPLRFTNGCFGGVAEADKEGLV